MFFLRLVFLVAVPFGGNGVASAGSVYTGAEVAAYESGFGASTALTNPSSALSLPSASTGSGSTDGNFSPFNPHYRPGEIVQVGQGGHLTLRLERFVRVEPDQRHLGVWENVFLVAGSGGLVGYPPGFFGGDTANVEVSADGINFVSLGPVVFSGVGNYWADSAGPYSKTNGTVRADFGRPFNRDLSQLAGADYGQVLAFLDGTAGGTWIDLSASGLSQVGWVRFSVVAPGQTLEIDAIAINTELAGAPTVVPRLLMAENHVGSVTLAQSLPHASYQLQFSDDLAADWRDLGEPLPGNGAALVFNDPTNPRPTNRFYRVIIP
jgi:hypothetical protein